MTTSKDYYLNKTWKVYATDYEPGISGVTLGQEFKFTQESGKLKVVPVSTKLGDGHWGSVVLTYNPSTGDLTGTAPDNDNNITISKLKPDNIHCHITKPGSFQEEAGDWYAEDEDGSLRERALRERARRLWKRRQRRGGRSAARNGRERG